MVEVRISFSDLDKLIELRLLLLEIEILDISCNEVKFHKTKNEPKYQLPIPK